MAAVIYYWALQRFEERTGYEHNQEIPVEEVFDIQKKIFNMGLNTMLYHSGEDNIILFVDDRRFTQR